MTSGMPRPPLRIMAPSGAPMKKNTRHATESVNFLTSSIEWRLMVRRSSFMASDLNS